MMDYGHCDLAVIGGGSAGMAAALAAGRMGARVLLVERLAHGLGGTATWGGINTWEPGVGGTGIPFDLYQRLRRERPETVGVYRLGRHFSYQDGHYWPHEPGKVIFPGGENVLDPSLTYTDTLRRHPGRERKLDESFIRTHLRGICFLPEPMAWIQAVALAETGNVTVKTGVGVSATRVRSGRLVEATLDDGTVVAADAWIDGAGGALAHACGCEVLLGGDSRDRFGEPDAPERASDDLNGVTLAYRVTPAGEAARVEPLPADVPDTCWWESFYPPAVGTHTPDGGCNFNMLPTMPGREWMERGEAAYAECLRRVKSHWHFVQTYWPEFRNDRLTWVAPLMGIREQYRVICEKMLTENDLRAGLCRQTDPDIIAIADHALDRHGIRGGGEVEEPYGIPYRCLIPRGMRNLLVAGRAAGFTSIAASSCRLTRTMMQLGQAAGTAAALAGRRKQDLPDVDPDDLREALRRQHVQLVWPLREELARYMAEEDGRASTCTA